MLLCFGHDSHEKVPRGALDPEDGFVHCSGVMVEVGGTDISTLPRLLQILGFVPLSDVD